MGSKNRIAKELLEIILKDRKEEQYYIEPFVGGCNIIDKVQGKRIGTDINEYLIEMWKGLQLDKPRPYEIDKNLYSKAREEYNKKTTIEFDKFLIGWIGWMGSFNGRFFDGGYSGKTNNRDYIKEQIKNTESQIEKIKDVVFYHCSYEELELPENSIIYCDIPYKNTKKYSASKNFNYEVFWNWVKKNTLKGHKVFVSEYNAPEEFTVIWQKEVTNSMNSKLTYKPIEKLFIFDTSKYK